MIQETWHPPWRTKKDESNAVNLENTQPRLEKIFLFRFCLVRFKQEGDVSGTAEPHSVKTNNQEGQILWLLLLLQLCIQLRSLPHAQPPHCFMPCPFSQAWRWFCWGLWPVISQKVFCFLYFHNIYFSQSGLIKFLTKNS